MLSKNILSKACRTLEPQHSHFEYTDLTDEIDEPENISMYYPDTGISRFAPAKCMS